MKVLAVIDLKEAQLSAHPSQLASVTVVDYFPSIDADVFEANWNEGINARQHWETFCAGIVGILVEQQLIDEDGFHFDQHSMGDALRLIIELADLLPPDVKDSNMYQMMVGAIKAGVRIVPTKKKIQVDWANTFERFRPTLQGLLHYMKLDAERARLLKPILDHLEVTPS